MVRRWSQRVERVAAANQKRADVLVSSQAVVVVDVPVVKEVVATPAVDEVVETQPDVAVDTTEEVAADESADDVQEEVEQAHDVSTVETDSTPAPVVAPRHNGSASYNNFKKKKNR
jgi:hypothetical protein